MKNISSKIRTFIGICLLAVLAGCGASESNNQSSGSATENLMTGRIAMQLDWGNIRQVNG